MTSDEPFGQALAWLVLTTVVLLSVLLTLVLLRLLRRARALKVRDNLVDAAWLGLLDLSDEEDRRLLGHVHLLADGAREPRPGRRGLAVRARSALDTGLGRSSQPAATWDREALDVGRRVHRTIQTGWRVSTDADFTAERRRTIAAALEEARHMYGAPRDRDRTRLPRPSGEPSPVIEMPKTGRVIPLHPDPGDGDDERLPPRIAARQGAGRHR